MRVLRQPVLVPSPYAYQKASWLVPAKMPPSSQPAAVEFEVEMSFLQSLAGSPAGRQSPRSQTIIVPPPYYPFGISALIVEIGERMVFRPNGKPLDSRDQARPLRHRPAQQSSIEFETKIVVKAAGGMLLDDELRAFPNRRRWRWLGGARAVPPLAVPIQPIRLFFRTHGRLARGRTLTLEPNSGPGAMRLQLQVRDRHEIL